MSERDEIEKSFAALRAEDARRAPGFDVTWDAARARAARLPRRGAVIASGLALAAAAIVVIVAMRDGPRIEPLAVSIEDPAPLAFLRERPRGSVFREDRR
ncbi:hypothetical protein [Sandaracinus amylolyticus]|uniref:hypothetical protein n=1 Tax=Sandaracinus amylolyticus TaxID=927083 RepID=UPI001F1B47A5|nr:hypothetical protein [Sandaracinus amylolyticus]UJR85700.1 Hypothetical protein I5071_77800 [Sandaracinus amylolyticus]